MPIPAVTEIALRFANVVKRFGRREVLQGVSFEVRQGEFFGLVGLNGAATASVAYHESLEYARTRPQGRPIGAKDPNATLPERYTSYGRQFLLGGTYKF